MWAVLVFAHREVRGETSYSGVQAKPTTRGDSSLYTSHLSARADSTSLCIMMRHWGSIGCTWVCPQRELLEAKLHGLPSPSFRMAGHGSKNPVKVKYLKPSSPEIILGIRMAPQIIVKTMSRRKCIKKGIGVNETTAQIKGKKFALIFEQMNETKRNEAGSKRQNNALRELHPRPRPTTLARFVEVSPFGGCVVAMFSHQITSAEPRAVLVASLLLPTMPKGPPKRSTAPRGPNGMFLSTQSHPNTSGSLDESENLSSDSDSNIGPLEFDSELKQDPDYTEDWERQPQPTTFEERRKMNEEKRARIAAKKRNAEICSAEHCLAGPANTQQDTMEYKSSAETSCSEYSERKS
ncbi:hypothetical protein DFH08DRAFT_997912 [Mycena albidolilacea]|uniref:Uncharacterized protein n=1 Tax=Mycena albidolilacea TaxID=1033008 RepID=A0AAD6YWP7_9AGAR|nr:hypothetical protein DFH08DRAFT_997912 [Mycena albidolilacea]